MTEKKCEKCLYYEKDNSLKTEYCHNNNGKYQPKPIKIQDKNCDNFKKNITETLKDIEKEHNITIIYAVESGSRTWGFSNINSDFDIRFIYKHNNLKEYHHINNKYKDVIEITDGLYDIVGWDIKKTLYLHSKSNPSLYEWLNNPKRYIDNFKYIQDLPKMNEKRLLHHYYNMGKNHFKKYCQITKEEVNSEYLKKLLYVTRCILTWNLIYNKIYPDLNIQRLITDNMIYEFIDCDWADFLLKIILLHKGVSYELLKDKIPSDWFEQINEWIKQSLTDMKSKTRKYKSTKKQEGITIYNNMLHSIINDYGVDINCQNMDLSKKEI